MFRHLEDMVAPPGRWRRLLMGPRALPDPVYRDFVDMLFGMRVPIAGMGILFVAVAGLLAAGWHDPLMGALAAAGAAVTIARIALIASYQHNRPIGRRAMLRRWEGAYAIATYAFAVLLGLLNASVLGHEKPHAQLIAVSLVFSFCAGTVARVAIRPLICTVSVLLATLPTAAIMILHAALLHDELVDTELIILEALLIGLITALSIQTIFHLYRVAVEQHISRHDLGRMARRMP